MQIMKGDILEVSDDNPMFKPGKKRILGTILIYKQYRNEH